MNYPHQLQIPGSTSANHPEASNLWGEGNILLPCKIGEEGGNLIGKREIRGRPCRGIINDNDSIFGGKLLQLLL